MKYRSQLHAAYAALRLADPAVKSVAYRQTVVLWQDGFTGAWHRHRVAFTVTTIDGTVEHVEVATKRLPLTKHLRAEHLLSGWRWVTPAELAAL